MTTLISLRTIVITPEVAYEFGEPLPVWILVQSSNNSNLKSALTAQLDLGEASPICLALEIPGRKILIDERKGRRIAQEMGLQVFGTIKLLIMAKEQGLLKSIRAEMDKLAEAGFRLSKALYEEILEKYEPPAQ